MKIIPLCVKSKRTLEMKKKCFNKNLFVKFSQGLMGMISSILKKRVINRSIEI